MKHISRFKILLPLMIVCMMIIGVTPASAAERDILKSSETVTVTSETVYELIDGVYEGDYVLNNTVKNLNNVKAHIVLVKPDAKATFKTIVPNYYTAGSTNLTRANTAANWDMENGWSFMGVTNMIKQYNSAADTSSQPVIAAINGDFGLGGDPKLGGVWTNAPRGSVIMEGNSEMAHPEACADEFFFGQKSNGALSIAQRTTGQKDLYQEAICGGAYILRNGVVESSLTDRVEARQRTGIGLKTNGEVMLFAVETGISEKQMAELMRASGCWNGINMDGGGSTTMVTKRAGDTSTVRRTNPNLAGYSGIDENGEREICSALMLVANNNGVSNTAKHENKSTIKLDKTSYKQGEPINVTATSNQDGAWVGIYKDGEDATDSSVGSTAWYYVYGTSDAGTWSWENGMTYNLFTDAYINKSLGEVGKYKAYVMSADYKKLAETSFEITENPDAFSMFLDSREYNVGDAINVTANAPVTSAWVGLYKVSENPELDLSRRWFYVDGTHNGVETNIALDVYDKNSKGDLEPGDYKIVFFGDGGYSNIKDTVYFTLDKQYKVTYKYGETDLTNVGMDTYSHNGAQQGSMNLPEIVDLEGHTFLGWYDNPELTGTPVTFIAKGSTGEKTFYGKFEKHSYTVTFDTDGGSEVAPQTVFHGDCVTQPVAPTKGELYFLGWVTEKGGNVPFNFAEPITGAKTVYAKWGDENGIVVSFDSNGGSTVLSQVVTFGGKAAKPANPTKTGYNFDKWVKADGSAYNFDGTVTETLTLKATWTPVTYSITFNSNGGSAVATKSYTVETANFTLPTPSRDGFKFIGWKDAAGKSYTTIKKGSTGNLALSAEWERVTSILTNKDTYVMGDAVNVTAYSQAKGAWIGLYRAGEKPDASGGTISYYWEYLDGYNGVEFNLLQHNKQKSLVPGDYVLYLITEDWGVLASKNITIKENPNPAKGTLEISGYSRDDKVYAGAWSGDHGKTLYEYFYGDAVTVKASVSGLGVDAAWVGVLSDSDYASGNTGGFIGKNWFYVKDFENKEVNLNYIADSMISEGAESLPFGLNYWMVLVSDGGQILDAKAFNFRTFNMDWYGAVWNEVAVKKLIVETEWSSRLANGTDQKPAVTLKRVNGHFGLYRDGNGELKEVTEEILQPGKDYTITYPTSSVAPGSYKIDVKFPSSGADYNYLSTSPAKYGFQDGISYYLTSSANDHVITYVLNGGVNHEDNPELYQTGTAIKLMAPAKAGFVFGGWYTTEDFKEGTQIDLISADAASDFTLYAKWISEDDVDYKIQYVLNGGDNDPNNPIGYTGTTDISLRPAKKAGYNFDGWFFDKEFTKSADVIAKGTTGNLKLYAKYTKKSSNMATITTSVKGGSISSDKLVTKGDSVTITYTPNKGYVLKSVTVDGVAVDITQFPSSYTFENVDADHTIDVVFKVKLAKAAISNIKTGNGKIQISWKSVNRAKEYRVYRSTNNKKYTLIDTTTELKYIDANVKAGQKYYYKVAAFANGSLGAKSAAKNIKAGKALTRAKLTSVVAKNGKVTAKWAKVKGAESYKLYRSADGGKTYKLVTTTKKTTFTTKKVQAAKWYRYKVVTVKNGIEGKMSEVKKVNVLDKTKNIKVSSKKKSVTVSWDKTKNAGKYEVYRSVDGGKTFKKVLTTKKTTATFKNLKAGSKHQYKVRAIYGKSYGKFTAVKKITVKK